MAFTPTPEDTAHEILSIFVKHFNCSPGNALRINNFNAVWHSRGFHAKDFQPGVEFAIQQGWVTISDTGDSYTITQAGFAAA